MAIRNGRWLGAMLACVLPLQPASSQGCAPANGIARIDLPGADTVIALPATWFANAVAVTGGDRALQFDADTDTLSGFLLDVPFAAGGTTARAQADAVIARFTAQTATLGATTVTNASTGRVIVTHDRFDAVVAIRIDLTLATVAGRRDVRNRAAAVAGAHALADFTGLATGGLGVTNVSVFLTVLLRPAAPSRMRILGVVGSKAAVDDAALAVGAAADDIVDGTALARANVLEIAQCDQETAGAVGARKADVLVSVYTGGSLDTRRPIAAATVGTIFDALVAAGADVRVGVVPHTSNSREQSAANSGNLRSAYQRDRQTLINEINNNAGASGCNFLLTAADDALQKSLPRTATGAESPGKLRGDAVAFVVYIDGEHAQEVESNTCGAGALGGGQVDGSRTTPNAAQQAVINTLVAPYITRLQQNDVVAHGLIQPVGSNFCDPAVLTEDGRGYVEVVAATGGQQSRVCDAGATNIANAMIAALPAGVSFALPGTPIASTLRVRIVPGGTGTPIEVPRSRAEGFDLDRAVNAVVIYGDTYRPVAGDRVDVSYGQWPDTLFANSFE